MFVDYAKIFLQAGDGGDGCVSFRREKYVPRGGPDGGDGGRGGDIYLVADAQMTTLLDLKYRPHYSTRRGEHGGGSQCTGADAEDLYIKVPLGTSVSTTDGEQLADLTQPGQTFLAAKGGRGGAGNQHYASSTNKAPRKFQYGGDGEQRTLVLELKVIADVGFLGLPNAGKSTLLTKLTAATPKIASYPFTTIHPNLGVMMFDDGTRCTLADIPGLIEGAHHGAGLGHQFLRHIERTRLLVHLVAPPETEPRNDFEHVWYAYELVNAELKAYSDALVDKAQIVCLSKTDLLEPEEVTELVQQFSARGVDVLPISAETGEGLQQLKQLIKDALALHAEQAEEEIAEGAEEGSAPLAEAAEGNEPAEAGEEGKGPSEESKPAEEYPFE